MPALHEQELKKKMEEIWQSGGTGDLALARQPGMLHPIIGAKWAVKRYGAVIDEVGVKNTNPSVIRDGDIYRMFLAYRATSTETYNRIREFISSDGKSWTLVGVVMTVDMVNATGYNVTGLSQPCVLKESNTYYMFFQANQLQPWGHRRTIFLATSTDGVNFSNIRIVVNPVKNSMRDGVWHPFVVKFRSKYYMVCIASDSRLSSTNPMFNRLVMFESPDLINWTFMDIISMEAALGEWDAGRMLDHSLVNINDALLLMVYSAEATAGGGGMRIGLCYSFDVKHWFRSSMLLARVLDSEAGYIADSSILYEGGKLKIWYEADDGAIVPATGQSTCRVMYAEAVPGNIQVMDLWINKTIGTGGDVTDDIDTKYDRKSFYIISDQSGTLYIQAYDEVANTFRDIDSKPVSANDLTVYNANATVTMARRMRLRFIPSAEATVSAWAVMS